MSIAKKISERLVAVRTALGINQTEMAERLGVSRNYVSMIEGGRKPSRSLLLHLEAMEAKLGWGKDSPDDAPPVVREEGSSGPRALLKQARLRKGLTVPQICKLTGYSQLVYQNIEEGRAQMGEKMIAKVARALDLDPEDLMAGGDHPPENGTLHGTFGTAPRIALGPGMEHSKAKFVPLLSLAQCGANGAWTTDGYAKEGFLAFDPKDKDAFAVTLAGDSMMPVYSPGDVALVYPNHAPHNGDLIIAVLSDEAGGDVMLKLYQTAGGKITLSSYNPAYPPMEFARSAFRSLFPVAAVTKVLRKNGH